MAVLLFLLFVGSKALRSFKQSRQAVVESASLLGVIVNALSSRVQASESLVRDLRSEFQDLTQHSTELERGQSSLRDSYLQMLRYLQEILSNDKRLVLELEQLKAKLASAQAKQVASGDLVSSRERSAPNVATDNVLGSLTPTERETVEILAREGPKAAPELGRRMRKSREHMARLMKKLYMEGYVDRESNHAPFRYRLNEKVRTLLESSPGQVTAQASKKA